MKPFTLVINCGSSSLKLAVFDERMDRIANALAENLGKPEATARVTGHHLKSEIPLPDSSNHRQALEVLLSFLADQGFTQGLPLAVGHRVVHGGETFKNAALIDATVIQAIQACSELAPIHNPVNLEGIRAMQELYPNTPQVAVFDTSFHQSLPEHAYLYGLPREYYTDYGIRRYGFHGTSHQFMTMETARRLAKPISETSLISAHLGNGCSITAIRNGKSVDTSMGLTPLEGLVMGTRSGDVDPGLFDYLRGKGISAEDVHHTLNRKSGLFGLSGLTNDMRALTEAAGNGNEQAQTAIDVFCFRLARYIGAMMASLDHLDALVFTGGIGENSPAIREQTAAHLGLLGFAINAESNQAHGKNRHGGIHSHESRFPIFVIPTDEERVIAIEARTAAGR